MATSTAPTVAREPRPVRPEPPRWHSGSAFFWGIVLILAAGFLAWFIIGYLGTSNFEDLDQKRVKERQEILQKRLEEDNKLLNEPPSYFDKDKKKMRVPLERAMQLALAQLQTSKPRAAYPLTDSPPQPAAAPTSPDKGAGSPKDANINPSASNPTLNQSSPAPAAAQSPTPANPPAVNQTPAPGAATTGTPAPAASPAASNNALNPGNAPAPGTQPQPSPKPPENTESGGASSTPSGTQPQPLTNPTPTPGGTPA